MTPYDRTMATVRGEERDHVSCQPLLMTFAARLYGAKYRDYVTDHRVLVAAQLAAAEEFGIDQVTCCSDAWREPADCGAEVIFFDDAPPACRNHLLADKTRLASLRMPRPEDGPRMSDRVAAVEAFADHVAGRIPINGWIEGPVAEAADLRGINEVMLDTIDDPRFVLDLFEWVTEMEIGFALAQARAGADIIGVGDAAASLLPPTYYEQSVFPYTKRMVDAIHDAGALVRLHVCGNTNHLLAAFGRLGADIIELDYPVDFPCAREKTGPEPVLLGNVDPVSVMLSGDPQLVRLRCEECYRAAAPRFIVGAGCEIPPATPHENVRAMVEFARERP